MNDPNNKMSRGMSQIVPPANKVATNPMATLFRLSHLHVIAEIKTPKNRTLKFFVRPSNIYDIKNNRQGHETRAVAVQKLVKT